MLTNLEKGDVVAIKGPDGQTAVVTVLSVKIDYEHPGQFARFDYINYNEPSPMRRTAWPKELVQIIKKSPVKTVDPKSPRPGDAPAPSASEEIIINGKRYVQKVDNKSADVGAVINKEAGAQVHESVKAPNKPVTSRINKPAK